MPGDVMQAIKLIERQLQLLSSDETLSRDHPEEGKAYRKALEDALAILQPAEERRQDLLARVTYERRKKIEELRIEGRSDAEILDSLFGIDSSPKRR